MCLMVYLGSSKPLAFDPPGAPEGRVVLAPAPLHPAVLAALPYVGTVASYDGSAITCSCVFHEESLPWEAREESAETVQAFARLRREVERQLALGAKPVVFGAWTGKDGDPPALVWRLAPEHLVPGHQLFQGGHLMPGGIPPDRYLLEFAPGIAAPEHEVRDVP